MESCIFELSRDQFLAWTDNFEFSDQIHQIRAFPFESRKNEHHHWILHILISLGAKFPFKQTILNFGTKFTPERHFWQKTENVNITTELCIFELVKLTNLSLNHTIDCYQYCPVNEVIL